MEKKIILDTNFLMLPYRFNVDIFSEISRIADFKYRICVLEGTVGELRKIADAGSGQKGSDKKAANLALELIKAKDLNIIAKDHDKSVDDSIVEMADPEGYVVATADKGLKARLRKKGVGLIVLMQKKHLEIS